MKKGRIRADRRHRCGQNHHRGQARRPVRPPPWPQQRGPDYPGHLPRRRPGATARLRKNAGRCCPPGPRPCRLARPAGSAGSKKMVLDRHHRPGPARPAQARHAGVAGDSRGQAPTGTERRRPWRHPGRHGDAASRSPRVSRRIFSKIDEAVKLGPAIDAAIRHQLVLRGVTTGQRVPEDWEAASADKLVRASHALARATRPTTPRSPTWASCLANPPRARTPSPRPAEPCMHDGDAAPSRGAAGPVAPSRIKPGGHGPATAMTAARCPCSGSCATLMVALGYAVTVLDATAKRVGRKTPAWAKLLEYRFGTNKSEYSPPDWSVLPSAQGLQRMRALGGTHNAHRQHPLERLGELFDPPRRGDPLRRGGHAGRFAGRHTARGPCSRSRARAARC